MLIVYHFKTIQVLYNWKSSQSYSCFLEMVIIIFTRLKSWGCSFSIYFLFVHFCSCQLLVIIIAIHFLLFLCSFILGWLRTLDFSSDPPMTTSWVSTWIRGICYHAKLLLFALKIYLAIFSGCTLQLNYSLTIPWY